MTGLGGVIECKNLELIVHGSDGSGVALKSRVRLMALKTRNAGVPDD